MVIDILKKEIKDIKDLLVEESEAYELEDDSVSGFCCQIYEKLENVEENLGKLDKKVETKDEVDWTKIPVDTRVYVQEEESGIVWLPRYFSRYENGVFYVFEEGKTSYTTKWEVAYPICILADIL